MESQDFLHMMAPDEGDASETTSASTPDGTDGKTRKKKAKTASRELDQFYTKPEVAAACMDIVRRTLPMDEIGEWIEPSAGTGVFFHMLPEPRRGFDIDEANSHEDITIIDDFLKWDYGDVRAPVAVVGNPPFGRNASLALRFVNRAARFAEWICMILPRTFEKTTMQDKVSINFELVGESVVLEPYSFIHDGEPYDVPCCFQIWRRKPMGEKRRITKASFTHPDFDFVSEPEGADFAFQRVGARAGLASKEGLERSWKSNHFIKVKPGVDADELMEQFNSIDWSCISERTAGNPSISKGEMIAGISAIRPPEDSIHAPPPSLL